MTACAASGKHVNSLAPGKGPYLLFAHYMPCFKAYGYTASSVDNYLSLCQSQLDRGWPTTSPIDFLVPQG